MVCGYFLILFLIGRVQLNIRLKIWALDCLEKTL